MIVHGDCLDVLRGMEADSVDSVVTDPPYGWKFMGRKWDYDIPTRELWAEVLRVLKPGGHLLCFCGTRTQHRMAVNIEDAGFQIRDLLMWVTGQGFPKSKNCGDGWGTALKPALEPITLARKPLAEKTVAAQVLATGTGALNVDGCRIETGDSTRRTQRGNHNATSFSITSDGETGGSALGRWPANLLHDGSEEVVGLFPVSETSGSAKNGRKSNARPVGLFGARPQGVLHNDSGSAARFFYCAKASKAERGAANNHPTVKPLALMQYLCRLVTPPGGTVLDPFCGSGSTGKAALMEGFRFIGIEREAEYVEIAKRRIEECRDLFAAE